MKLISIALLAGCLVGCSFRSITYKEATYRSFKLGSKEEFGGLTIEPQTNGTSRLKIDGYKNDQAQVMGSVVESAIRAAVGK